MSENKRRRALVVGGSMSGLLTALMLRRAGWQVDIYERAGDELAGRGAGIVAQPELIATLRELGFDGRDLGVEITARRVFNASGEMTAQIECPQTLTSWERVHRILRDLFGGQHYHRGVMFTHFGQDATGVVAHLSTGETAAADMLVGADGLRSAVREQCIPRLPLLYAGYVGWRALIPEASLPTEVRRDIFGTMAFGLPPGEQFLVYPVAGPDDDLRTGERRLNVIWYRPAEEHTVLAELLTDDAGVTHALSIPPPLIRRAAIEHMRGVAERLLAPQFRAVVRLMKEPILQPIYDLETPRMAFGRVAILGDAAFLVRPHVGAGVSKAAGDAVALARAVAGGEVEAGLRCFESERLPIGRHIVARARHLGAYLQATKTQEEEMRAGRHSTEAAVLAETALVDFLD